MAGLKVGDLAKRTGISVRTLHHYEEIGLLSPLRADSGHRVYGADDVNRLQRIMSLRSIGLSLDEIARCLDSPHLPFGAVIDQQIDRLDVQLRTLTELRRNLEGLRRLASSGSDISVDELLRTMELMNVVQSSYTLEQLEWLKQRREEVGEDRIREVEAEWPRVMAEVRAEMEAGTDPKDPKVQELMERWRGLVAEFTGGNPGIKRSLQSFYENEDTMPTGEAIDRELFAYVGMAMQ